MAFTVTAGLLFTAVGLALMIAFHFIEKWASPQTADIVQLASKSLSVVFWLAVLYWLYSPLKEPMLFLTMAAIFVVFSIVNSKTWRSCPNCGCTSSAGFRKIAIYCSACGRSLDERSRP